jgi:hypothetical protein
VGAVDFDHPSEPRTLAGDHGRRTLSTAFEPTSQKRDATRSSKRTLVEDARTYCCPETPFRALKNKNVTPVPDAVLSNVRPPGKGTVYWHVNYVL